MSVWGGAGGWNLSHTRRNPCDCPTVRVNYFGQRLNMLRCVCTYVVVFASAFGVWSFIKSIFYYKFQPCISVLDIVQEQCESRGGRPGLSVLTSLLVSVDVKIYCTVLRHWSQLVPNMSTDIWHHFIIINSFSFRAQEFQSSGAVWKSRWTSWASVPNKPTVSVDVKQPFNQHQF